MPYFKDLRGNLHFLDSTADKNMLPIGAVKITDAAAEAIINPPKTAEQITDELEAVVDAHLDAVAQAHRYTNIHTMISYATSTHPVFGPEGIRARDFRDEVYSYGIQVIADVNDGKREIPTAEQLIAELPKL